jgi:hypothetical protein
MTEQSKGLRALPPALVLAFAVWIAMTIARLVFLMTVEEPWSAVRFHLVSEGTSVASEALAVLGAFELARRLTGRAALGIAVAAWAFAATIVLDVSFTLVSFKSNLWEHEWVYKAYDYAFFAGWLAVPIGLAIASWHERRALAVGVVLASLLTWPPPFLAHAMYSWMPSGKTGQVIEMALRLVRIGCFFAGFAATARGATVTDRMVAASGLRLAGKALWLRVIAALSVVLLTLMVISGKGSKGSIEMLQLAMMAAAVINIVALAQFGVGAVRAARGKVAELGAWPLALGGAASLWASGVTLGQLPWLYKMLYQRDTGFAGGQMVDYAQALAVAMPIVVTAGVALVAVAISGLAARRANDELRADAQAKGAGYVALTLVSLAIQAWMLAKATSMGSFTMLTLLAAGAGLVATVMMAKLCGLGAAELEREPGLPTATIVSEI